MRLGPFEFFFSFDLRIRLKLEQSFPILIPNTVEVPGVVVLLMFAPFTERDARVDAKSKPGIPESSAEIEIFCAVLFLMAIEFDLITAQIGHARARFYRIERPSRKGHDRSSKTINLERFD